MRKYVLHKLCLFLLVFSLVARAEGQVHYENPILAGFYPDPSICRVGNDYYLVNSSFSYFPGLPVMHSTDLVNWSQIGNAMNRNSQLTLTGGKVSGGLFAPTIRFHDGVFYIICTNVTKGGNFIVTATDPDGPWSDPIWLPDVNGIDPSLFFDDDGKAYITYNSVPPGNKPLYNGHRTIRLISYDVQQRKTVGPNRIIVNGGSDISKHPVWIEGPHLYKIKGNYYLMCAEGGTAEDHSEVIFRSTSLNAPFESYENNPILTQRDLDKSRLRAITCTGHADLVETPDGRWYAVFLGCRPYVGDYFNTGRETFMSPVVWKDGWPEILKPKTVLPTVFPVPFKRTQKVVNNFGGDFKFRDDFNGKSLNFRFVVLRNPSPDLYDIAGGKLSLPLKGATVSGRGNPAFIGFRQANQHADVSTSLNFNASGNDEKAGLIVFQNESHYYYLCKSVNNGDPVIQLIKSASRAGLADTVLAMKTLNEGTGDVKLQVKAEGAFYGFYYATGSGKWKLLKDQVDAKFLSTKVAGGFVGCMFGMYCTSTGRQSSNRAKFDWFDYIGQD